ncbi:MAG: DUF3570 domain-containing protein [Bacteroidetes bacterium]|nr:DUF3570 domain-containing protein [Bacteroidota bacterium]
MKKIYLSVIGFALICRLNVHAQTTTDTLGGKKAPSLYTPLNEEERRIYDPRDLHVDEVNLVSSYYWQTGDHSAIQGGIGSENVTDFANGIDLKLAWGDPNFKKNSITIGMGYDHHTAASQAWVSKTGASRTTGDRFYPSFDYTVENPGLRNTFGFGAYYSGEYNYHSLGADIHFSQKTASKNGEFSAKLQAYFDRVSLIYPSEFVPQSTTTNSGGTTIITTASGNTITLGGDGEYRVKRNIPTSPRTTFDASFGYSQIISPRLQIMFLADVVGQNGYLSLPFHRVYFNTAKDTIEKLPSNRFKLPLGFRANYFLGDNIILRAYYRYYEDSWGIRSNTAGLEVPIKISPFFSISPFYRYYDQTAARYFAPYEAHSPTDPYYTSNYEYSKFNANFYGVGFRIVPQRGVFGMQGFHDLEIRYGHYAQTTGLASDVVSLSLGFK